MTPPGPHTQANRLATIMVADVVGYSRLMDTDEAGTYAALRTFREEVIDPGIEASGGRIVKHLGDGFLAEFPAVMAAVQFAMSLQEEMHRRGEEVPRDRQLRLRIGINLGDIIVDPEGDIFGDGVNVAARLEALAIPGGICVSGPVYRSVHKKLAVRFDDLGEKQVKNIPTPVHAYDLRWQGEGGTPEDRAAAKPAAEKGARWPLAVALAAVLLLGYFAMDRLLFEPPHDAVSLEPTTQLAVPEEPHGAVPGKSIAVLPFVNMSDDEANEYFSDGISEELINLLAKIPDLRVIARTSAFSYKGKNVRLSRVAGELSVTHILEGSVRKAGDRVRVTAQLIEAGTEGHLWSETYDRTLDDVFAIQDEIAARVVEGLQIAMLDSAPRVKEVDPRAYALLLEARQMRRSGSIDWDEYYGLIDQVLAIEPNYPEALMNKSSQLMLEAGRGQVSFDEALRAYDQQLAQILEIDPDYAPAFAARGSSALDRNDFATAASDIGRAMKLDPKNNTVLFNVANLLMALGRVDDAIAVMEYLVGLDPVNAGAHDMLGVSYSYGGRMQDAFDATLKAQRLNPVDPGIRLNHALASLLNGEAQAALDLASGTESPAWMPGLNEATSAMALYTLGRKEEYRMAVARMAEREEMFSAALLAWVHGWAGQADEAFALLDSAAQRGVGSLHDLWLNPLFGPIRDDPRWKAFRERIGSSPEQLAKIEFEVQLPAWAD